MHYYSRNIGDYAKDAGWLSTHEHGIYTLLMDWYYANERPIPVDLAPRIARATPAETQVVTGGFFKLDETAQVWRHDRIDSEIAEYQAMVSRNRDNGKKGGRPRAYDQPKDGNPVGSQSEPSRNPNHKPVTKKNSPPTPPPGGVARRGREKRELHEIDTFLATIEPGTPVFPEGDPLHVYCEEIGLPFDFAKLAWRAFVGRMRSRKKRQRDWRQTFRNYVEANYLRLWYVDDAGGFKLTTTGIQAQRKMEATDAA